MLVIGIVLAAAGLLCLYLGPRRVITTTVNKVEHEYKTSTDYERLYDLLMEGMNIIVIKENGIRHWRKPLMAAQYLGDR